ncbi:hypothetical protein ERJ75_001642400 [Trypanosoma vivax]|nr:hypothetical protein ERJ75_001642400 [Trypanosoma vivax]
MAKLPWVSPKAVGEDKVPRPLFNGHKILRRNRITRADNEKEQRQLLLQRAGVGTLSPEWAERRIDSVWRNALWSPDEHSSRHEPQLGIDEADAKAMERIGAVREALRKHTEGSVVPFGVAERKAAGLRRRLIALPKGKNDHNNCEAGAPLQHESCYSGSVFGEVATVSYMRVTLFQVNLPQGNRTSFLCRAVRNTLVGDPAVVSSRCAAPKPIENPRLDRQYSNQRLAVWRRKAEPCCNQECEAVWRHVG